MKKHIIILAALVLTLCPSAHAAWRKVVPLNSPKLFSKMRVEKCSYRLLYSKPATGENNFQPNFYFNFIDPVITKETMGTVISLTGNKNEQIATAFDGILQQYGVNPNGQLQINLMIASDPSDKKKTILSLSFADSAAGGQTISIEGADFFGNLMVEATC